MFYKSSVKFNRLALLLFFLACLSSESLEIRVAQYVPSGTSALSRNYPDALPGLLGNLRRVTGLSFIGEPLEISSFADERLLECPLLYVNWDDGRGWAAISEEEVLSLRHFLESGGFLLLDAGISAEFLRGESRLSQHHSFAEWEERPPVREFFSRVLPGHPFVPLSRDDAIFRSFYQGLPDPEKLPPSVRDYTLQEKWPNGTYSAVGIRLDGRLAVLATPVIAMGWGTNTLGGWSTTIRMRILEGGDGLSGMLPTAAVLGPRYQVRREDGGTDQVFCQGDALPAWVHEPTGRWRVFRYYDSRQISDYTHIFYTRLGVDFILAALLGE